MKPYTPGEAEERPWGSWRIVQVGSHYATKILRIKPFNRLSLQRHFHRDERWVVCQGEVLISIGEKLYSARSGETVYVPSATWHRLSNVSKDEAVIMEVQFGTTLSEEDIERANDDYGR